MGTLYKLDFPNGKSYIGITTKCADMRFRGHRQMVSKGKTALYAAWRKHGAPKMTVLALLPDEELADAEIRAIAAHKTLVPAGYNSTAGGDVSPLTDPAVAAKLKGNKHTLGKKFPRENYPARDAYYARTKGVALSEERKEALRAAQNKPEIKLANAERMRKQNPMRDPEIAEKQAQTMRGRVLSESHKESARRVIKTAWTDPEFRANQVAKRTGKKHSPETIARMKIAQQLRREREKS